MLTVCTWKWGTKFGLDDVAKLARGVRRNLVQPYRFICFSDERFRMDGVEDAILPSAELTTVKGCFARLRMFDPSWQPAWFSDRLACIDLDTVITGPLDALFDRPEPYLILQGGNASNPCKFNGALQMIRAGAHPEVWRDFSIEAAGKVPFYEFPDDQGWIWHKLPNAAGWKCGIDSGVFVFRKPGWPSFDRKMGRDGDELPKGARLVTFSGGRSPQKEVKHLSWVRENWR